jgi:hypothetical protein
MADTIDKMDMDIKVSNDTLAIVQKPKKSISLAQTKSYWVDLPDCSVFGAKDGSWITPSIPLMDDLSN